jgi:hypothetical protein
MYGNGLLAHTLAKTKDARLHFIPPGVNGRVSLTGDKPMKKNDLPGVPMVLLILASGLAFLGFWLLLIIFLGLQP